MVSNQVYLDHNGQAVETVGMIPDVAIEVFPDDNLETDHLEAVRKLIVHAENQSSEH